MADGNVRTNFHGAALLCVDYAIVLDVGAAANDDGFQVATEHRIGSDETISFNRHLTNDNGSRRQNCRWVNLGRNMSLDVSAEFWFCHKAQSAKARMEVVMRTFLVTALMVAVALAGCTNEPEPVALPDCVDAVLCNPEEFYDEHYCTVNDVRPRIYAPDTVGPDTAADPWELGRSWTYSLEIDGEDLGVTQLIYYGLQDGGQHYMVGTPTRDEALQHAVFSTNPVIGRVHKSLYSPHESGAHADMFNFPLCEGSTWSDTFFGVDFDFTAYPEPITLPDGTVDQFAFRIQGIEAGGSTVTIRYSPVAKWFTTIDLDRADGSTVTMELVVSNTGFSGDAFFLRGQKDAFVEKTEVTQSETFAVNRADGGAGPYDTVGIYIDVARESGTGFVELHVRDPDGNDVGCVSIQGDGVGQDTACVEGPLLLEAPFKTGDWQVQVMVSLIGQTSAGAEARIVSIYDRSCTVGGDCLS